MGSEMCIRDRHRTVPIGLAASWYCRSAAGAIAFADDFEHVVANDAAVLAGTLNMAQVDTYLTGEPPNRWAGRNSDT